MPVPWWKALLASNPVTQISSISKSVETKLFNLKIEWQCKAKNLAAERKMRGFPFSLTLQRFQYLPIALNSAIIHARGCAEEFLGKACVGI